VVIRGDSRRMLQSDEARTLVLFLRIQFEIRQKEIQGYVALLMDIPSLDVLRILVADLIRDITQKGR
jgi:chemotaxis protein CheC